MLLLMLLLKNQSLLHRTLKLNIQVKDGAGTKNINNNLLRKAQGFKEELSVQKRKTRKEMQDG